MIRADTHVRVRVDSTDPNRHITVEGKLLAPYNGQTGEPVKVESESPNTGRKYTTIIPALSIITVETL